MALPVAPEIYPWLIAGLALVLVCGLAGWAGIRFRRQRRRRELHAICHYLGWEPVDGLSGEEPLHGQFLGRTLHIWESLHRPETAAGMNRSASAPLLHIAIDMETSEDFRLELSPDIPVELREIPLVGGTLHESALRIKQSLGLEDLQLGNEPFDNAFLISGRPVEGIREILDESIQSQLLQLRSGSHGARSRRGLPPPPFSGNAGFQVLGTPRRLEIVHNGNLDSDFVNSAARFLVHLAGACEDILHDRKETEYV